MVIYLLALKFLLKMQNSFHGLDIKNPAESWFVHM